MTFEVLPEKIRELEVSIGPNKDVGQLLKASRYEFRYLSTDPSQADVALLMPSSDKLTWQESALFAPMDQNLPEGELFMRIRAMYPKQPMTPMHLLALIGSNGIGRLGYQVPGHAPPQSSSSISKENLLKIRYSHAVFDELISAYLSTGIGIAGMQPKIMVPERSTVPIPSLIVKAGSDSYPGLVANEYLCLSAAKRAEIDVPEFALSDDGQMLVLDRFDLVSGADGQTERLGFEDIAALAGLRVRDVLSDRKYHGSYQRIAELLRQLGLPNKSLQRFFEQVAFSVLVGNGDAHLKNFGVLYRSSEDIWLAPMFDVVTTCIYKYVQYPGGPELEDRTMALKLFVGRGRSKSYPTNDELLAFGRLVCGVTQPQRVLDRLAEAIRETMNVAVADERIPKSLLAQMKSAWESRIKGSGGRW